MPSEPKPETSSQPEVPVKPRSATTLAKAKAPTPPPKLPVLQKIVNDIIELDPDYYFRKRYDDIKLAASELPVVIEYINESLQRAAISAAESKRDLQALEAETYTRLRQEWSTIYSEKMTEKALEMAVFQDQDLSEATKSYSVLKSYVSRLANMQDNLRAKLDMLRSVEATRRRLVDDPGDRE
jgi:hypothetical protein